MAETDTIWLPGFRSGDGVPYLSPVSNFLFSPWNFDVGSRVQLVGRSSAGGNVSTLTGVVWPPGLKNGDIALLLWSYGPSTALLTTLDSNLSILESVPQGNIFSVLCGGILDGTESGTLTLVLDTINRQNAILEVWRGVDLPTVWTHRAFTEVGGGTNGTHVNSAVTPSVDSVILSMYSERLSSSGSFPAAPGGMDLRDVQVVFGSGGTTSATADATSQVRNAGVAFQPDPWSGMSLLSTTGVTWSVALPLKSAVTQYTTTFNATISMTSSDSFAISKSLTASLAFSTSLLRSTLTTIVSALVFTGAVSSSVVHLYLQAFNATMSFTSNMYTKTSKVHSATLGFTGSRTARTSRTLAATTGFTGSISRRVGKVLPATVGFTSSQNRAIRKGLSATLSFTGSVVGLPYHLYTKALNATVGFTGSTATAAVHIYQQAFNAVVGFTGNVLRRPNKALSATLGSTGTVTKRAGRTTSATVGASGALTRRTGHLTNASLPFTSSMSRRIASRLTGSLSFVGTKAARTTKTFTATVGSTGNLFKRTGKKLAATLGFNVSIVEARPVTVTPPPCIVDVTTVLPLVYIVIRDITIVSTTVPVSMWDTTGPTSSWTTIPPSDHYSTTGATEHWDTTEPNL